MQKSFKFWILEPKLSNLIDIIDDISHTYQPLLEHLRKERKRRGEISIPAVYSMSKVVALQPKETGVCIVYVERNIFGQQMM